MRLQQYINEGESLPVDDIKEKCKKFIDDMKGSEGIFYRGLSRKILYFEILKSRLNDRCPTDTNLALHNILNKHFEKKFGWKVRNGVFTFGNHIYSAPNVQNIFMPIGEYKFCWVPNIKDLIDHYYRYGIDVEGNTGNFDALMNEYITTNLHDASESHVEVSFKCDTYYLINRRFEGEIKKILRR